MILFVTFLAYIPSLGAWYQADDFIHKILFSDLSFMEALKNIIAGDAYQTGVGDKHYRPITNMLLWSLLQFSSFIYARIFILILHLCNGYFLYKLLTYVREKEDIYNLWGVAFFLTAPVASHSLLYVSAIGDPLTTTFSLLSVITILRYLQKKKCRLLVFTILFFLAALLSKEMAISLPLLTSILLWKKGYLKKYYYLPLYMIGTMILFFTIRTTILKTLVMGESYSGVFFSFGKETIISLIRYGHKYTHPLAPSLVAETPTLMLLGTPLFLVLISFLFPF